ncbi:MAG: YidC/Oxa1 family membrane protein insertase [Clostridia bacterium]|nr:YidC/Oxa1 family membrane protein insertase [Clostridia bacterium]
MFNILSITTLNNVGDKSLNWIGNIIKFIIERPFWSVGIGIIIFTLVLKLITMPFDVFSRIASKSNSLKMEKMRPELERLQKQYANNKQLYQQKVMALQKKAGYSPFSACLPSILAIVIFIVAINAFQDYTDFANRNLANNMINAYNHSLVLSEEEGKIYYDDVEKAYKIVENQEEIDKLFADGAKFSYYEKEGDNYYSSDIDKLHSDLQVSGILLMENYNTYFEENSDGTYKIVGENAQQIKERNIELSNLYLKEAIPATFEAEVLKEAQLAAEKAFKKNVDKFLWIKNIWVPDAMHKNPLEGRSNYGLKENDYKLVTAEMKAEKDQFNGYYILVVLSVGIMVLSQLVSRKEQKVQMELQTVEGKDSTMSQTQKVMMVMMPIMYGVFAFIYTSAFSIYMIVSSLFSMLSTMLINVIVTRIFAKKAIKEQKEKENSRFKFKR